MKEKAKPNRIRRYMEVVVETISQVALCILIVFGAVIGFAFALDKPSGAHKFIRGATQRRPMLGHTGGVVPYLARYQAHQPFYGRHRIGHSYGI